MTGLDQRAQKHDATSRELWPRFLFENRGSQNRPKYIMSLVIGTTKIGPFIFGNSHLGRMLSFGRGTGKTDPARVLTPAAAAAEKSSRRRTSLRNLRLQKRPAKRLTAMGSRFGSFKDPFCSIETGKVWEGVGLKAQRVLEFCLQGFGAQGSGLWVPGFEAPLISGFGLG